MSIKEKRVIALIDCDCFFVSCERVDDPDLLEKPVCVVTSCGNRGIVVSRSNEAKKLGIKMGMSLFQMTPDQKKARFIPVRHARYAELSEQIIDILREFTPQVEVVSIDEAYVDLTGMNKYYGVSYRNLVRKIRQNILDRVKIPVSIGISTSKILAKLASDQAKKSGGIFVISSKNRQQVLNSVSLNEICGIGKQTIALYRKKGIETISEFLNRDIIWIQKTLGMNAERLWYELSGRCLSDVSSKVQLPKSIQDTKSFSIFSNDLNVLIQSVIDHIHCASRRLRKLDGYCKNIEVILKTKDFKEIKKNMNLIPPTNSELTLIKNAVYLIQNMYQKGILYRSVGVSLNNLDFDVLIQPSLFEMAERENDVLSHLIDTIETKFGKNMLRWGQGADL